MYKFFKKINVHLPPTFFQDAPLEKADEEICLESGETSRRETPHRELPEQQPPQWFYTWMDKVHILNNLSRFSIHFMLSNECYVGKRYRLNLFYKQILLPVTSM